MSSPAVEEGAAGCDLPGASAGKARVSGGLAVDVTAFAAESDAPVDRHVPHPSQAPAAPSRAAFAAAGPVIVTGDPKLQGIQVVDGNSDNNAAVELNTRAVALETDLFVGRVLVSVRGTPTAGAASTALEGRRTFHIAAQGRFKRPFAAADLVSGQEYPKAPRNPTLMHFVFAGAAKVFASTTNVFVQEGKPMYYHFPVLAAAQLINVSRPGEEPDLLACKEDVALWCPELAGKSADRRRALFDKPSHLAGRTIGPELVWTIHIHQCLVDFTTYKLGLPGVPMSIDLVSILDAQPLQIMAKDAKSGDFVFNLLVWAERLLYEHEREKEAAAAAAAAGGKGRFKNLLSRW